ncbi:SDR family NAD(P)-dependent oxidoreductase [Micromonosporaceae bacterium Da 78-11]
MAHTRTALITGGSQGIGWEICRHLVSTGTWVILHAPTPPDAHAAVDRLVRDGADPALMHAVAADYCRLENVRMLGRHLDQRYDRIDLLVNNASALGLAGATGDGFDAVWQVNYLAPYVLTRLLGRSLNNAAGRVVTVVSALHRDGRIDLDLVGATTGRPVQRYADTQLALVFFSRALALSSERRVTSVAVHPGCIDTGTFHTVGDVGGLPVVDGAAHVLHAAGPAVPVPSGAYYEGLLLTDPAPAAGDDTTAVRLWTATARLLGWDYAALRTHPTAVHAYRDATAVYPVRQH